MENRHGFSAACRVLSVSGLIATLYVLIKLLHEQSDFVFPFILMICGLVICPLNTLFIKKERSLGIICLFNAVIYAVFLFVTIISGCLNETFSYPYAIIAFLLVVIYGTVSVVNIPKLSGSIVCFDGAVIMLILICLYVNVSHYSFSYTIFSIIGTIAGLLGLIAYRNSGTYGKREWGLIIILFLIIALIAWFLFAFVVSPLSSGFELAGSGIAVAFTSFGALISRFFKYIASLINTDDGSVGSLDIESSSSSTGQEDMETVSTGGFPIVIMAVILAAAIVVIAILIIKQRKNIITIKKQGGSFKSTKQKNTAFSDALAILVNKIRRHFESRRFLKTNRNRAEGVYFQLIRETRHTDFEKKEGDTATEFLLRLKSLLASYDYDTLCFDSLIPAVNNNFYGMIPDDREFSQVAELKKNIRKAINKRRSEKNARESLDNKFIQKQD